MPLLGAVAVLVCLACLVTMAEGATPYPADTGQPGDAMIQKYLARETEKLVDPDPKDLESLEAWQKRRPEYRQEYFYMIGLSPMPEKTPLQPTITGTVRGDGYVVDLIHYQSLPHLYVTGNLYRPAQVKEGERLPAVYYTCGHSYMGRNGNKTAYQSHGIWLARHGYVCLTVDSLQLGEIAGIHHGTYRENRWWWYSRGYAPVGVECWNGIRGIDYLVSRPDVDPERIAATGISGGGASTSWIGAADERVKVAVPVSGWGDAQCFVTDRVINGHCDCMVTYNALQWPVTRMLSLVAPRALLFTNSDHDALYPMDSNERVINRLKRVYSLYGASDFVDCFVSVGEHAYRKDLRQGIFRFLNMHLKNDARVVTDTEVDLPVKSGEETKYAIPVEKLRVFPTDADLPKDALNGTIDQHFVAMAKVAAPQAGGFEAWKKGLLAELRRVTFGYFPGRIPAARPLGGAEAGTVRLKTEPGIEIALKSAGAEKAGEAKRVLLVVQATEEAPAAEALERMSQAGDAVYVCLPRGVGPTRWTTTNPPNYVARAHALLGRTVETGRVWDVIAAARHLRAKHGDKMPVVVAGQGTAAILAAYAALLEEDVAGAVLADPPASHMDAAAPPLLNVLRVCDVPEVLGMLAPRPLTVRGGADEPMAKVAGIYAAAGAAEKLARR